jgi:hypothetical protein
MPEDAIISINNTNHAIFKIANVSDTIFATNQQ